MADTTQNQNKKHRDTEVERGRGGERERERGNHTNMFFGAFIGGRAGGAPLTDPGAVMGYVSWI